MNSYSHRIECRVRRDQWLGDGINVLFVSRSTDNGHTTVAIGQPVICAPVRPENENIEPLPTFRLQQDEAQNLMDELWRAGLRPTEGTGSAGALAAVQRHLEDMRMLVFKTDAPDLGVEMKR